MPNYLGENKRFLELFVRYRTDAGHKSDAAAARALGLTRQNINDWKTGRSKPDVYACTRIAVECRYDPIALIAELEAAKETSGPRAAFWRVFFSVSVVEG